MKRFIVMCCERIAAFTSVSSNGYRAPVDRQLLGDIAYLQVQLAGFDRLCITASEYGYFVIHVSCSWLFYGDWSVCSFVPISRKMARDISHFFTVKKQMWHKGSRRIAIVIICFRLYRNRLRGFEMWGAKNWGLPFTLTVTLTTGMIT